ncbi:MFS transporter [Microvirga makkahensis]|uniref:MFS transporter n=1 Tax=Microvirga makkahensis TaxID=1128670 RepID=UPI001FE88B78|nr:MFS transporter [Microvirga makkahensis]
MPGSPQQHGPLIKPLVATGSQELWTANESTAGTSGWVAACPVPRSRETRTVPDDRTLPTRAGSSPSVVGVTLGAFNLAFAAASLGYGYLRGRIGILGGFALGFGLMAVGYGIIAAAASHAFVLTGLVATGAGMGCIMPDLMAGAMTLAPPSVRGGVAGGLTASILLGQFLSPLASQPWVGWFGYGTAFRDMGPLLGLAPLLAVLVAVRSLILPRRTGERPIGTLDLDRSPGK